MRTGRRFVNTPSTQTTLKTVDYNNTSERRTTAVSCGQVMSDSVDNPEGCNFSSRDPNGYSSGPSISYDSAGMCQRKKPALWRQPALLSLVPVPALLRFWDSLNKAGTGTIEAIIDSFGGVYKL